MRERREEARECNCHQKDQGFFKKNLRLLSVLLLVFLMVTLRNKKFQISNTIKRVISIKQKFAKISKNRDFASGGFLVRLLTGKRN